MDRIAATDSEQINTPVREIDQKAINEFSRNNSRLSDLQADTKEKKQLLETLSDAQDEIALVDDDGESIKLKLGDSYINVDEDAADEVLSKRIDDLQSSLDDSSEEISALQKRQAVLKKQLYARFGTAINLEK